MDFEYAMWQMWFLLTSPQKVYRNFQHRKQTRNQFARDDPAFLVLLALSMIISTLAFSLVLDFKLAHTINIILWVVFVDCIGVGIVMATILWLLANRVFRPLPKTAESCDVVANVEWGYAFDIHLNAIFPLLIVLHLFQLPFLSHVILHDWFISRLIGNTFWLIGIGYYVYITFLGFSSMRFLKKTEFFLYMLTISLMIYLLSLVMGWNFTQGLCYFYKYRVK